MLTMTSDEIRIVEIFLKLARGNSDMVYSALKESAKRNGGKPNSDEVEKLVKEYISGRPLDHLLCI